MFSFDAIGKNAFDDLRPHKGAFARLGMMLDYYQVLGVTMTAPTDEIRAAYKWLSRLNHPDSKPNDHEAIEKFKQVQDAWDVLGDPEKRRLYDSQRTTSFFSVEINGQRYEFDVSDTQPPPKRKRRRASTDELQGGIANDRIADTPIAVVDLCVTGPQVGNDRVIEVAIVRVDPGCEPSLVFDSLVNPSRKMKGTEYHGITESDVATAPRFAELAETVFTKLSDCVVAGYGVYNDLNFLRFELENAGVNCFEPPHLDLMFVGPMLRMGTKCKLEVACANFGITLQESRVAAHVALASARLWNIYLAEMQRRGISTFRDLAKLKHYQFVDSFGSASWRPAEDAWIRLDKRVSRAGITLSEF